MTRPAAYALVASMMLVSTSLAAGVAAEALRRAMAPTFIALRDPCLVAEPDSDHCRARMREAMARVTDPRALAQRVAGPHWQKLSNAERDEFTDYFALFLARRFLRLMATSDTADALEVLGERREGDFTVIKARVKPDPAKSVLVPVDLRMELVGYRWLIRDLLIENASFVNRYRDDYNGTFAKDGFAGAIARLKREIEIAMPPRPPGQPKAWWAHVLDAGYTLIHRTGSVIVRFIQEMVHVQLPADFGDTIGTVALMTVAVLFTKVAGTVMWWAVAVAWILIVIRVGLLLFGYTGVA